MGASVHLRRYADFSPRAKAEYRSCMQEEGALLREHGYPLAPPMPFEAVGGWIDAGMPTAAEVDEPLKPLIETFDDAVAAAFDWREQATGGGLTVDAILAGVEGEAVPLDRWVESVLASLRRGDERLEALPVRVRVRILLALAYETLVADEGLADAAALRAAMHARATAEA